VILYLDTSALLKLYVEEPGSPEVEEAVGQAEQVATATLALPEAAHALARRASEGSLTEEEALEAFTELKRDWRRILHPPLSGALVQRAARLAWEKKGKLRGADAVHLATALALSTGKGKKKVRFLTYDERLRRAAAGVVVAWKD
jgi:predicted nucleic acid-binding protein